MPMVADARTSFVSRRANRSPGNLFLHRRRMNATAGVILGPATSQQTPETFSKWALDV